MKNPCHKCPRRAVGCAADCAEYAQFRAENEERYAAKKRETITSDYLRERYDAKLHRQHRRNKPRGGTNE